MKKKKKLTTFSWRKEEKWAKDEDGVRAADFQLEWERKDGLLLHSTPLYTLTPGHAYIFI